MKTVAAFWLAMAVIAVAGHPHKPTVTPAAVPAWDDLANPTHREVTFLQTT